MNQDDKIKGIVADIAMVSAEEIILSDTLESIGIDSLAKVELFITLEDAFGVIFDVSELDPGQLTTVDSVIALTEKYVEAMQNDQNEGFPE